MKKDIKLHFADCISMSIPANPIFSLIEMLAEMTIFMSVRARIIGSIIPFLGIGIVIARGRDLSKKLFKIKDKTSEKFQTLHDALYLAIFHLLWVPIFYLIIGARNPMEILTATFGAVLYGFFAGGLIGGTIDIFRDLTGLQKCERKFYPRIIRNQNKLIKFLIIIELLVFEILLMGIIYIIFSRI